MVSCKASENLLKSSLYKWIFIFKKIEWFYTKSIPATEKDIPFFVRPFARKKIEIYAQENSISLITLEIYEQVKQQFNKKFG
jgi:hypothetical protein